MTVRKHMSAPPIAIADDTDFKSALALMQKHRIRRLPVVNAEGVLIGIVAERDLLVAADRYLNSPVDVERIMTRQVVTVDETTPVIDAAMLMVERKIGGLPVVDPARRLLGIITETDLLKALAATLGGEGQGVGPTKSLRRRSASKGTAVGEQHAGTPSVATKSKAAPKIAKIAKTKSDRKRSPVARKPVKRRRSP